MHNDQPKIEEEVEKKNIEHKKTILFPKFKKNTFIKETTTSQKDTSKIKENNLVSPKKVPKIKVETFDEKRERLLNNLKESEKKLEEKKSKLADCENKKENYKYLDIDVEYKNKRAISKFKKYLESGKCDNYKSCISLYEKEQSQIRKKVEEKIIYGCDNRNLGLWSR